MSSDPCLRLMASTCLFIGALVQFGVGFAFPRYHTEWREQPSRTVQRGCETGKTTAEESGRDGSRVGAVFMADALCNHMFSNR